ncbi:family 16 glycoside hydrolase [Gillisia sp. Q332]|uniref:family 16 glycoside hydrolase n=1 Tax=Gillisia xinjiangensis TaxID=3384765 RepID=UPI003918EFDE
MLILLLNNSITYENSFNHFVTYVHWNPVCTGMDPTFNKENTDGWEQVGDGNFILEDGLLRSNGGMGLLWFTGKKFENSRIKVVYKGADKNNAGVFIRIPEKPTEAWMPVNKGFEVQIDDRGDEYHKTGVFIFLYKSTGKPGNSWGMEYYGNHTGW